MEGYKLDSITVRPADNGFIVRCSYTKPDPSNMHTGWEEEEKVYAEKDIESMMADIKEKISSAEEKEDK